MSFRMGGLFIQAQIENGLGTFEIGSNNAFVNSLSSISVKTNIGQFSEIELEITPTFTQAVSIIEDGFLGYGYPLRSQGLGQISSTFLNGIATPVESIRNLASSFISGGASSIILTA
jgi:hypothetical protein